MKQLLLRLLAKHVKKKREVVWKDDWAVLWVYDDAVLHEQYYSHLMTPFKLPTTLSSVWTLAKLVVWIHMHMGVHSALAFAAARPGVTTKKRRIKDPPLAFVRLTHLAAGEYDCVLDGAPCRWRAPPDSGRVYDDEVRRWLGDPKGISELYISGEKDGVYFIGYVVALPWLESKWQRAEME